MDRYNDVDVVKRSANRQSLLGCACHFVPAMYRHANSDPAAYKHQVKSKSYVAFHDKEVARLRLVPSRSNVPGETLQSVSRTRCATYFH